MQEPATHGWGAGSHRRAQGPSRWRALGARVPAWRRMPWPRTVPPGVTRLLRARWPGLRPLCSGLLGQAFGQVGGLIALAALIGRNCEIGMARAHPPTIG